MFDDILKTHLIVVYCDIKTYGVSLFFLTQSAEHCWQVILIFAGAIEKSRHFNLRFTGTIMHLVIYCKNSMIKIFT
jgi:hypothetical protein